MPPAWISSAAEAMWSRLSEPGPFPRDVRRLARYGLRVFLVPIPGLTLLAVQEALAARRLPPLAEGPDRRLHGCLCLSPEAVAREGRGALLFLDSRDSDAEQRWTVAHELGHLWCEILEPTARTLRALGPVANTVLAGAAPASAADRLSALLHRAPLRPRCHLMERDPERGAVEARVWVAEAHADRLALELLAPEETALQALPRRGSLPWAAWKQLAAEQVAECFGLPFPVAAGYTQSLAPRVGAGPGFWERLSGS